MKEMPLWMANLDKEDCNFIKNFIITSGSLKEMASRYHVTYPTVRLRLDKVIQKVNLADNAPEESYITLIKELAVNDKMDYDTAKLLVHEYRKMQEEK